GEARMKYHFENVFDWRSGPRRGFIPAPIPIQSPPWPGPAIPREGLVRSFHPMSFSALGLAPGLLRAVAAQGYTDPTPVQREAIPHVLAGRDLMAGAQTGTGKTAAFGLPMLQRLVASERPGQRRIRALILAPTRELALQVEESVRIYGSNSRRSTAIYGGVGFVGQVNALRRNPEIVVATPGRLLDHARQRTIDLSSVEILVLDEADRMLDMGFIRDIRRILALLPQKRQNLLCSATFSDEIKALADGLLHAPALIEIARHGTAAELVTQTVHTVHRERKRELLHVPEDYVHRIGRTGRAGSTGEAISLVCGEELPLLADIERLLKRRITREVVPDFQPDDTPFAASLPAPTRNTRPLQRTAPR